MVCFKESCGKRFATEFLYQRHLDLHKIEDKKPFECPKCDIRFETEGLLEDHAKIHNKHNCSQCDKSYYDKHMLKR